MREKLLRTNAIANPLGGKMLSRDQTIELLKQSKEGSEKAKEELLKANVNLIKSIVKRFLNKGVEYDDLYQLGCMGFLKAVNNFDEKYGVMFSTYAVPLIIGEIKRFMRDDGAIKVSRAVKVLANKINRYNGEYRAKNGSEPRIEDIAEHFNVETSDVVFAIDSARYPVSLNSSDGEDDDNKTELMDKISAPFEQEDLIDKIMLRSFIENLPEREKKVIMLRYFRDKTQSEIASELGVSQVQVSRMESKIIEKMKECL